MLPKKNKLDKKLFNSTFKDSKIYHSDFLYLKISKTKTKNISKFAFVVPIKVFKKATERNKIKRQGYNIINKYLKQIETGFIFIFFLKKQKLKLGTENYEKEIIKLLKQAGVLNN